MAFTSHPSAGQTVSSTEFAEHMAKRDNLQPRVHEGFDFSSSGLTATIDPGVAFIRGKDVGDLADDPEDAALVANATNYIYLLRTGALSVNQSGIAPADSILLYVAETDSTDVIGPEPGNLPEDHRDDTVFFNEDVRVARAYVEDETVTDDDQLTPKSYVDDLVAHAGVRPVRVVATSSGTLASDFEAGDTIDGVVLVAGDRILLTAQAAGAQNRIYTVNASGAPTVTDDTIYASLTLTVEEGTAYADSEWILQTNAPITLGTTVLTWGLHSVKGQRGTANGLATLTGGVHTESERPTATTTAKGDAMVGTATPEDTTNNAASTGSSTTRWAREDHVHKLADMIEATVKGRAAGAGTGSPVNLTAAQLIAILLAADGAGSGLDADLLDGFNTAQGAATASTVPVRTAAGAIFTGAPTDDAHAATQLYVNQKIRSYSSIDTTSFPSAGEVYSEGPLLMRELGAQTSTHTPNFPGTKRAGEATLANCVLVPEHFAVGGATAGVFEATPWNPATTGPPNAQQYSMKGRFKMSATPAVAGNYQWGIAAISDGGSAPMAATQLASPFSTTEATRDNVAGIGVFIDASGNILYSNGWSVAGDATLTDSTYDVSTTGEVEFEAIFAGVGSNMVVTVKIKDSGGTWRTILNAVNAPVLRSVPGVVFVNTSQGMARLAYKHESL